MNMARAKTVLPLLLVAFVAVMRVAPADEIDDYLRVEMEKQHVPGVSLAVLREGEVVKAAGYGLANLELNVSARPETVYKIGSISKQFIATGIMLLIEDGKLQLDDKITSFLEGAPETWNEITVRHLLTHTSGLVREAPGFAPFVKQADATVIKTAYDLPLRFAPGEKWQYCNVGYFALAEIIRKVSGQPWGEFLKVRVFTPLEMRATRTTSLAELVPNRADGYLYFEGKYHNATDYLAVRPSGAFLSTVLDLARWNAALYGDKVLKQSTRERMWTPVTLNNGEQHGYGFGWAIDQVGSHKRISHGGSLPGFRAELAWFADDKLSVIVLTNGERARPDAIALEVAKHYVPDLAPEPAAAAGN